MNRKHAYCKVAISPVRESASDASEQVTQLLFGEVVELIEMHNQWVQIRTFSDNYEGYVDLKHLVFLREKDLSRWLDGLTVEQSWSRKLKGPEGVMRITRGAFRPSSEQATFSIAGNDYEWIDEEEEVSVDRITLAKDYLNTPYLWGGKSTSGIDCSGFMQIIHRIAGINLPRDAKDQFEHGIEIDWSEREAGDLVFFKNANDKIHHVGLLINENEIIHASGYVRIDEITKAGIVRKLDGFLSHTFFCIKRV